MAITKEDMRDFNRFVDEKLDNGEANSLAELASEWESLRRNSDQNLSELDEHTACTLAAAFPDAQDEDKLRQALARRGGITTAQLLSKAASAAETASHE